MMEETVAQIQQKRYESYKDSKVDWLENIPRDWSTLKMKRIFSTSTIKNRTDATLLSVTQNKGVVPREWVENRMVMPSGSLESFKYLSKGDFAISLRSFEGGIEYCHHSGIISPAYTVLKMVKDFNPHYFKYLFKSASFISELQSSVVGIRDGKNVSYPRLSYSLLPIPPKDEQDRIASFLDEKIGKIDSLIANRRNSIEHLFDLITAFVLTGSEESTDIPGTKDWLNSYPAYWKMEKAKRVFEEKDQKNNSDEELLAVTQDKGIIFKSDSDKNYVSPSGDLSGLKLVSKNDYVISLRSFQGGIETSNIEGIVSPAYNVFHLKERYQNEALQSFYKYLFKTPRFINMLDSLVTSIRDGKNISFNEFSNLRIPVPEPHQVEFILSYIERFEKAKSTFRDEEIRLLEFKNVLINSAVTGKIKV